MTVSRYWHALRWLLLGWLLLCLSGLALTGGQLSRQFRLSNELARLKQQLQATRQQVMQNASYQADVAYCLSHRTRWQQQKLSQPADLQQWAASWLALQQRWQLPHMQYEIQPAIHCAGAVCDPLWPGQPMPALSVTVTPVKMYWSVSHETEVMDWLRQLQEAYGGMFVIRGCSWALEEGSDAIAAQCELHFFNLPQMFPVALSTS